MADSPPTARPGPKDHVAHARHEELHPAGKEPSWDALEALAKTDPQEAFRHAIHLAKKYYQLYHSKTELATVIADIARLQHNELKDNEDIAKCQLDELVKDTKRMFGWCAGELVAEAHDRIINEPALLSEQKTDDFDADFTCRKMSYSRRTPALPGCYTRLGTS